MLRHTFLREEDEEVKLAHIMNPHVNDLNIYFLKKNNNILKINLLRFSVFLVVFKSSSKPKIAYFEVTILIHENIRRLKVSVHDIR